MIDRQLAKCLDPVAARIRQFWMAVALGIIWMSACLAGLVLIYRPLENITPQRLAWWLLLGTLTLACISVWAIWNFAKNYSSLARRIEAVYPDLGASLLTAVEQQPTSDGSYSYLQHEVLRRAYLHSYEHPWNTKVMPKSRLLTARMMNILGLIAFAAVLIGLFSMKPQTSEQLSSLAFDDVAVIENPEYTITVEPGTTEVEKGTSLLVMARFNGPLPPDATLVYHPENGEERRLAMSKSLRDPVFGGRILSVETPLSYQVEYAEQTSEEFQVTVFEYPRLQQADARLQYPSYTNLEEKLVQDVRRLSVVEGTTVTLLCRLNKPVAEAKLTEEKSETSLALTANVAEPLLYQVTFPVEKSRRLTLHLKDAEGRGNQNPPEFTINALPNRPPDLKLAFPSRDVQVSPVEELDVKASAWDDYGLARVGLSFSAAGQAVQDVTLGEGLPAKERAPVEHLLSFEAMNAEPDQLVSYFFWAEDIGPDGQPRRTSSDMYFAEVRHFEEIFRQGQQPTAEQQRQQQQQQQQQGSQNAREAERLAELQKQIINGTWKVIRRETRNEPSDAFAEDVQLLLESQLSALEQTTALEENLQDEQSLVHVDQVRQHMQEAIVKLEEAVKGPAIDALQPALVAEQSAYQSLLKLRAREHEVVRSNQQQQSQSQSQSARQSQNSRAQQQLQQLQLREDENRYETERQANTLESPEAQEQAEDRQVLNRLRELSQRQNDLNERIKELQSSLEEAQTQAEREEIERRLKRLQEEQQQILRDTEELQQRMEQPENQERMANEREQLDQARESARQSSEALQEGQVSRAAAEGTRAEREFRELQNEFQRKTSGQFNQELREMQQQARDLEQKEQELANQLAEANKPQAEAKNSLRDDEEQKNVGEELSKQRERIEQLLDRMRRTVEEAEGAEPLLAEQLYDTIRNTRRNSPQTALENAERSFNRGLLEDAQTQERKAQEGITQIRQGIDRAAENILGDETEALRRAQAQLDRLNRELEEEIARNGQNPNRQMTNDQYPNDQQQPGQQQPGQQQPGQQQPGQQQPGQQQPGQQQPGQQQPGQQQPGQQQPGQQQPGQQQPGQQQPGQQQPNQQQPNGQGQPGQQQPNQEQSNEQPGQQQSNDQQPNGQRQPGEQQPNQQQPNGQRQPGQQQPNGQRQPGQQQPNGQRQPGQQPNGERQPGQQPNGQRQPGQQRPGGLRDGGDDRNLNRGGGALDQFLDSRENRQVAPLSGEDFLEWSDRLRDVEEMLSDPKLRAEAARIRDRAKAIRKEVKRHSKPPNWDIVREMVSEPLVELQNRVASELLRQTSKDALVPLDRDPVPPKYEARVRKYYERLGAGK